MTKLPILTPHRLIKILESHGFRLDRSKGSHHIYLHPETHRRVVVPIHNKDLPKGTLLEILRQAGISKSDLDE
jgi:predicted RNA binding protein YcfA (HicA-like mRNA interferase family)